MSRSRPRPFLRRGLAPLVAVLLVVSAAGCQFTKSEFANEADTTGSEFAAAAPTLEYLHEGKLPRTYAKAAFVSYRQAVEGSEQRLASASGAPAQAELQPLLDDVRLARDAIDQPCLDAACEWQGQVATLRAASDALAKASEA